MKKLIILGAIALSITLFHSCVKDETTNEIQEQHLAKNEVLNFNSIQEYSNLFNNYNEDYFNTYINNGSFTSLRKAKINGNTSKMISSIPEDDMDYKIYDLVNAEGFIQLGNYLAKLNFSTRTIYIAENPNQNTIDLMRNNIDNNTSVFSFSFDYDVTELLELCEYNNTPLAEGIRLYNTNRAACPGHKSQKFVKTCKDTEYTYGFAQEYYSIHAKLAYAKFGVYFVVKTKVKNYRKVEVLNIQTWEINKNGSQSITYKICENNRRKKKCKLFKGCHCIDKWLTDYTGETFTGGEHGIVSHKAYEGARGLQSFGVSIRVNYRPNKNDTSKEYQTNLYMFSK